MSIVASGTAGAFRCVHPKMFILMGGTVKDIRYDCMANYTAGAILKINPYENFSMIKCDNGYNETSEYNSIYTL